MKLYGIPASRAIRSIWAAEETGVDYELVLTHHVGDSKKPEYLALNPNGRAVAASAFTKAFPEFVRVAKECRAALGRGSQLECRRPQPRRPRAGPARAFPKESKR